MMYIVLTAMLALNVASEVLEAFRIVDASLTQTLGNIDLKNDQVYASFAKAYAENPAKVKEWKEKAEQVREKTDSLIKGISDLKVKLVIASGGAPLDEYEDDYEIGTDDPYIVNHEGDTVLIKKEDDLNTPSEIMIQQKKANELKKNVIAYKNFLTSVLDEDSPLRNAVLQELSTNDPPINLKEGGEKKTWEIQHFDNRPLIAVVTLLSKIQIDVRNAEANVISNLYSQIDANSFKFNKLGAQILPKSNYVLEGDQFEAQIFLAAEDTTQEPEIFVNNQKLAMKDGKGIYKVNATAEGTYKWGGLIKYKTPEGNFNTYPFEGEYQVGKPSVTISPTKMNVFYQGIPNPIKVSVPGVPSENLKVTITNGKIEKAVGTDDDYMVFPDKLDAQGKRTSVAVMANFNGIERPMGSMPFRVKEVPPPVATISGLNGGAIRKEELLVEDGVFAVLRDFDFDLKFTVTQFDITFSGASGYVKTWKSDTNRFTRDQREQFTRLTQGSLIFVDNIIAKGDDGTTRTLAPISFKIR